MDNKIIAIILVVIVAVAGVAVYFMMSGNGGGDDDAKGLSIVGRVNSEGSGILLKPSEDPADYITVTDEMPGFGAKFIYNEAEELYYVFNVETWGGKVFATPGAATIQHVQLMELASLMGLKYVSYTEGSALSKDTLYYVAGVPSFSEFTNKIKTSPLVGFIIWEAQYAVGVVEGYKGLALTNDLFEGHTCCIIGTSNKFIKHNEDTLATFFSVYVEAVKQVNAAIADPDSVAYSNLLAIAKNRVSMPDGMTDEEKVEAIELALRHVTYVYADDETGSLTDLKSDISELAESLVAANQINKSASDLGFKSYDALADKFVQDKYMKEAISGNYVEPTVVKKINVAAISGDIHQIALWYAIDMTMFAEKNLAVIVSGQGNGPAVYGLLSNGEADIGFLGAPPMTIRSMNAEEIHA